tara:strand:+ start:21389 stop:23221 length:1833 start_codon:yes stop_codon:yes gene_type:complete
MKPSEIDYSDFNPYSVENIDEAVDILQHLKKQERSRAQDYCYAALCQIFELEEVTEPYQSLTKEMKILIASDFLRFVQYAFMCEKGFKFKVNWHHVFLARTLEMLYRGELPHPNLILNIPPRYSKTQMAIYFTAWTMGLVPDAQNIHVTYSGELAESNGGQVLECVDSDWYRQIFNVIIDQDHRKRKDWYTTKKGRLFSTSTGGRLTGVGAGAMRKAWGGYIWVDDPHKAEDIKSKTKMQNANDWFVNTCLSRRNAQEGCHTPFLIIMQRLSEDDLTYHCLPSEESPEGNTGEKFNHFNIPAILTREDLEKLQQDMKKTCRDFDIYKTDTYTNGDHKEDEYALWPGKHNLEKLRNMRRSMPVLTFYGQYMQKPYAEEGLYFRNDWFEIVNKIDYNQVKYRVIIADTALTDKKTSDYSVFLVACVMRNGRVIIEDVVRGKWKSPELLQQAKIVYERYKPNKFYIEYKTSGITLVQLMKSGMQDGSLPVFPIKKISRNSGEDKITRAEGVSPFVENGAVKILRADWNKKLLHEAVGFPNAKNDDIIDTVMDLVEREVVISGLHEMNLSEIEKDVVIEKPVSSKAANWRDFYGEQHDEEREDTELAGWGSFCS